MNRFFRINGISMRIELPEDLPVPENMNLFEISADDVGVLEPDFCYTLNYLTEQQMLADRWADATCYRRRNMIVYVRDGLECRFLFFGGADRPYAIAEEIDDKRTHVYLSRADRDMFLYDTVFSSVLSMECRLINRRALILHCAYMQLGQAAVLFSAPSGTGKSTQAMLWEKYRGTRQINGDAAILSCDDGRWFAHGFQICGSSGICHNESYPIKCIVMLYQDAKNTCRSLSPMEAFRKLYPQIKINMWNPAFQDTAISMIEKLIEEVPVFELGCDISEDAVKCLEEKLPR